MCPYLLLASCCMVSRIIDFSARSLRAVLCVMRLCSVPVCAPFSGGSGCGSSCGGRRVYRIWRGLFRQSIRRCCTSRRPRSTLSPATEADTVRVCAYLCEYTCVCACVCALVFGRLYFPARVNARVLRSFALCYSCSSPVCVVVVLSQLNKTMTRRKVRTVQVPASLLTSILISIFCMLCRRCSSLGILTLSKLLITNC